MSPFAGVLCHDNPCISRPIPSKKVVLIDFVSTVRGSIPDSVLIFSISTVSCRAKCGNSVSRSLSVSERKINFARQETVLIENINTESGIDPLTVDTKSINTTFFDGIGRLIQGLSWQSTPAKGDIVTPVVYDNFGREHRKYLPASLEGTGYYRPSLLDASGNFTNSSYSNSLDKIADD